MSPRAREVAFIASVFGLVLAIAIGHTVWGRYQQKLDYDAQMRLQKRSNDWALEILQNYLDESVHKKGLPTEEYWDGWVHKHDDTQYLADCRRLGTHLAINRALCGHVLWELPEPQGIPLIFEAKGADGGTVLDVESIASQTRTGMFVITWADGHGYPYGTDAREETINRYRNVSKSPHEK